MRLSRRAQPGLVISLVLCFASTAIAAPGRLRSIHPVEITPIRERPGGIERTPKTEIDRAWDYRRESGGKAFNEPRPAPPRDPTLEVFELPKETGATYEEVSARLEGEPAKNVVVSSPEMVAVARRASAPDTLVLLRRSSEDLSWTQHKLFEQVHSIETLVSIPHDVAEARAAHGHSVDTSSDYWAAQHRAVAEKLPKKTTFDLAQLRASTGATTIAEAVSVRLRESEASMVTLLAEHRGGALRFVDGSVMPTADAVRPTGKLVTILGCTTATKSEPVKGSLILGTGRKVTYGQAIDIAGKLDAAVREQNAPTTRDMLLDLQNSTNLGEQSVLGVVAIRIGVSVGCLFVDMVDA